MSGLAQQAEPVGEIRRAAEAEASQYEWEEADDEEEEEYYEDEEEYCEDEEEYYENMAPEVCAWVCKTWLIGLPLPLSLLSSGMCISEQWGLTARGTVPLLTDCCVAYFSLAPRRPTTSQS